MLETVIAYLAGCLTGAASFLLLCAFLATRRGASSAAAPVPARTWRQLSAAAPVRIYGTFTINGHGRN